MNDFITKSGLIKVLFVFTVSVVFSILIQWQPIQYMVNTIENRSLDYRFRLRGRNSPFNPSMIVVYLDNKSVLKYGFRSPTPRRLLADLISSFNRKKAKIIGVDILLDVPLSAQDDRTLEKALTESEPRVVLISGPQSLVALKTLDSGLSEEVLPRFSKRATVGYASVKIQGNVARGIQIERVENHHSFVGQLFYAITGNRIGETYPMAKITESGVLLLDYQEQPIRLMDREPGFSAFSAFEALSLPRDYIENKIILIGSGIEDLGDVFQTPFSTSQNNYRSAFGIELHAIALDMLLQNHFLKKMNPVEMFLISFGFIFATGLLFIFANSWISFVALFAGALGWLLPSVLIFNTRGLVIPVILPLLSMLIVYLASEIYKNIWAQRQTRFLSKTFKRYLSPQLVDLLARQKKQPDLGGEIKRISIMFSDLEGYTSISEKLTPYELVNHLNSYLGRMTKILHNHKGTLDKYEGDAIIALFGTPLDLEFHAIQACLTALRMQKAMNGLNQEWSRQQLPAFRVRIGINTGVAVVGHIGSEERIEYTAIGDEMNLASRLEGINKFFGTLITISENTLNETDGRFHVRELAKIVAKGKTKAVRIYELIGEIAEGPLPEDNQKLIQIYGDGLRKFFGANFYEAAGCFRESWETYQDPASKFMLDQSLTLKSTPPAEDWEGEIVMMQK